MTEFLIFSLSVAVVVLSLLLRKQRKDFTKATALTMKGMEEIVKTIENIVGTVGEHSNVFKSQNELNQMVFKHLEVLGVHTKLVKPTIGYEAEAYLAWINKKKEDKNGEI